MNTPWITPIALVALGLLVTLSACQNKPQPDPQDAQQLANTPYPQHTDPDDLDIVVTRDGPALLLTNRTPVAYRSVQLWINQQYVYQAQHIPVGSETRFELSGFVNRHGESFPIGGFLTPDKTRPVVLAEMYIPTKTHPDHTQPKLSKKPDALGKRFRLLVR